MKFNKVAFIASNSKEAQKALKGVNENEIQSMIEWAHNEGHEFTIIETMPMGEITEDRTDQYLPLSMAVSYTHLTLPTILLV